VQRLVQQMKEKAVQERMKQQALADAADDDEVDEEEDAANASALFSTSTVLASLPPIASFGAASTTTAKPWRQIKPSESAPAESGGESNPNVIHMLASEFRDDDWSEIERRRARANLFRAKSPTAVRRLLERPSALPKRQPRESTVPEPFSFDSETASFEQLADFRPPPAVFKASAYHAEHAHELEFVRQQGKNRYVAPKPLTIPESPALKTRERVELHQERHGQTGGGGSDDDSDDGEQALPRTISFDRVSTRDMPHRATFKPQLTIPESPGLLTNERGEMRREQSQARAQAELEREEAERAERAERVLRAIANGKQHAPQRRELTVPESPAFLTKDRANMRRELLDSIREHQDVFDESIARAAPYDDRKDAVRAVSFDQFVGSHDVGAAPQRAPSFKQERELTVPESPAFLTRDRAQARRQLQERALDSSSSGSSSNESFDLDGVPTPPLHQVRAVTQRIKQPLTVPESPMFATGDRSDMRREQQRAAAERADHDAELARVERDVRERRERLAARHYVAQRRALTVPESPALFTKMRGEVHDERFQALVREEEARADELEAEARMPLRRIDSQQNANNSRAAPVARKPKSLTIPESPALLTKMRSEYSENQPQY
jgi:hypothetical protein